MPQPRTVAARKRNIHDRMEIDFGQNAAPKLWTDGAPLRDRATPGDFANRARPYAGDPPRKIRAWRATKPTTQAKPSWQSRFAEWAVANGHLSSEQTAAAPRKPRTFIIHEKR